MGTLKKIAKKVGRYTYKPAYKAVKTVTRPVLKTVKSTASHTVDFAKRAAEQAAEKAKNTAESLGKRAVKGVTSGVKTVGKVVGKTDDVWKDYLRKPVRQIGAVTLPIAGAMIGGPLGVAAGLQGAARLPEFKEGWKKNASYLGMDEDDAMKLANYGALGAGAYGLSSMAFGGSPTSWSFGGSGNGIFGLGGGAAGKGGLAQMATPTSSISNQMAAAGLQPGNAWASTSMPGFGMVSDVATPLGNSVGQAMGLAPGEVLGSGALSQAAPASMASHGWNWFQPTMSAAAKAAPKAAGGGLMGKLGAGLGIAGGGMLLANMLKTPKTPKLPELQEYPPEAFVNPAMVMEDGPYTGELSGIGGELQSYGRDLLDQYQGQFSPLNVQIARLGAEGYDPNFYADRYSAELAQRLNAEQEAARRNMERMGINPNSPRYASQNVDMALGASLADATARQQGREWAEGASRDALLQAANFGVGLQNAGLNALNGAANLYGGLNSSYLGQLNNSANLAQSNAALQAQYIDNINAQNQAAALARYNAQQQNNSGLMDLVGTLGGTLLGRYIFA